ncbi:MAG: SOS response-associated peptidase [Steroidobacteraceae bacterium]
MCRCYVSPDAATIEREFELMPTGWKFAANFNTTPAQVIPVIRANRGKSLGVMMRWGFAASGSHAPVETLASGADSRESWKRGRRCIIPALGFYEWHVNPDSCEQPYYIHPDDHDVFGFAGLWARVSADANTVTECCSIITLPPNRLISEIQNPGRRMPAMLTPEQRELWLFGAVDSAGTALAAYPDERLLAYPVSDRINSPHNDDESLVEPLETDVD